MNHEAEALRLDEAERNHRAGKVRLVLPSKKNPKKWVIATGTPETRSRKAAMYLKAFNHKTARQFDYPELTLAKVVCNLRRFYCQSREETIRLIQDLLNQKGGIAWSAEGIGLTWDLVEPYTPSLGLRALTAIRRHSAHDLYDAVVDLVLLLEPGGRVLTTDLYAFFLSLNPDLNPVPTDTAFGAAIGQVTGKTSTPSKGKRYYSGFRIPERCRVPAAA